MSTTLHQLDTIILKNIIRRIKMTRNQLSNKLTTRVEDQDLTMERIFDAPRELVFKAFSKPEHLANWWGPKGWETINSTFEFKPEGVWHYCMRCTDKNQGDFYGQELWCKSVYHEIVVPEKIIYTDAFSDEEGNISDSMPGNLVTLMFVEHEAKTKLIMRYQLGSSETAQEVMDSGFINGLRSSFDRLDDFLKEEKGDIR